MSTPTTLDQAHEAADLYRDTGTPVSVTMAYDLASQVQKLTAERDALKNAARLALDALEKGFMGPNYTNYFAAQKELKAVL